MRRVWSTVVFGVVVAAGGVSSSSCAHKGESGFAPGDDGPAPSFGSASDAAGPACVNLQCRKVVCRDGAKTTLVGTVRSPARTDPDPLYNAIVYVPNGDVAPFDPGITCDQCGVVTSGSPVVSAVTNSSGKFTIEDPPVGDDIPLVVQIGKWRRQVAIPRIEPCVENVLGAELTRLPRNKSEGDIPHIAISTGYADPVECVLRKIGLDQSEFTLPSMSGRVHIYHENGADSNPPAPSGSELYSSPETLASYDMILLPCEGGPHDKPPSATQNMVDYANHGGRVLTSHYGYVWIKGAQAPFPGTATWNPDQGSLGDPASATIDTSFPKGIAFSDWLLHVGASLLHGDISIKEARHDVDAVSRGAQRWIYAGARFGDAVQHFTFNTPFGAPPQQQCGRVIYSDFHVAVDLTVGERTFPGECDDSPLSAQEKLIEFMLFDLAACIEDDGAHPKGPKTH